MVRSLYFLLFSHFRRMTNSNPRNLTCRMLHCQHCFTTITIRPSSPFDSSRRLSTTVMSMPVKSMAYKHSHTVHSLSDEAHAVQCTPDQKKIVKGGFHREGGHGRGGLRRFAKRNKGRPLPPSLPLSHTITLFLRECNSKSVSHLSRSTETLPLTRRHRRRRWCSS